MSDPTSLSSSIPWLRFLGAALLLSVAYIAFSAWTATPAPKVAFHMTAKIADHKVTVGGSTSMAAGKFAFDGSRIGFAATVEDGRVSVDGQISSPDQSRTKTFKGGGTIVDGRATVTVKSSDGNRVGALNLDFNPS